MADTAPTPSRTSILYPALYLALVTALLYGLFSHWAYDDPFITYRYAENLSQGRGLVYNPGEPVLSTTTPLFALLLAVLAPVWSDLPHLANFIGAFGLALGGIFLWDLARSWQTPAVGWAGLLLYPTFPLLATTFGSETPLYLAFCLGAYASYARRRYVWTGALAALAVLARPDGALVVVILGIDYLVRVRRPIPWGALLVFLALTLPWFGFAWSYYGSPLPVTLAAKQQQGALLISERFAPGFLTIAKDYIGYPQYWVEAALALVGTAFLATEARRWLPFLAWTALYFLAYSVLGVSRYYWYYAPLVPGFVALVGLGLAALARFIPFVRNQQPERAGSRPASGNLLTALPLLLVAALALAQVGNLLTVRRHPDRRAAIYQGVGEWLRANTAPAEAVGALEVGIIGYYAGRPVVDFAGLIQPQVAAQLTPDKTYEDAAIWAMERFRPAYLVLGPGSFARLEAGFASQNCQVAQKFSAQRYDAPMDLVVYHCR